MKNEHRVEEVARRVAQEAEESFLDPMFGSLDLSSQPLALESEAAEESFNDDRFGQLDLSATPLSLRHQLDQLVRRDAANDPELCAELERAGIRVPGRVREFHGKTGGTEITGSYHHDGRNHWHFDLTTEGGQEFRFKMPGDSSEEGADTAAVSAVRYVQRQIGGQKLWRELTPDELLVVTRMARQHQLPDAVLTYLSYSLRGEYQVEADPSTDHRYLSLITKICWFVFENSLTDPVTDDERQFLANYTGSRVVDVGLLLAGHAAYQRELKSAERRSLLGMDGGADYPAEESAEEIVRGLDDLSDTEIEQLRGETLKAYAQVRRSRV